MKDSLTSKKTVAKTVAIATKALLLLILLCSCWLLGRIVFSYIPFNESIGFLIVKRSWLEHDWWRYAFQCHVYSSGIVMLAGFTQFWDKFRYSKYKRLHRWFGYVYVVTILAVALPSGFVLALTALGGLPVKISFTLLCILWGITTSLALYYVIRKQIAKHRVFMVYSYALTLSAVTLRTLKILLYKLAPYNDWLTPMHIYQTESVLSWGINLLIAWVYLKWSSSKVKTP